MMRKNYKIKLLGATDSNMEALVDSLIRNEGIDRVAAGDYRDGYELYVKFADEREPGEAIRYLSRIIPKRFGQMAE